jgi:hypothetical protein
MNILHTSTMATLPYHPHALYIPYAIHSFSTAPCGHPYDYCLNRCSHGLDPQGLCLNGYSFVMAPLRGRPWKANISLMGDTELLLNQITSRYQPC